MRHSSRIIIALMTLVAVGSAAAQTVWDDGFESYPVDGLLHGQGGWAGWNDVPDVDTVISDLYAHTGSQSVLISGNADIVQQFSGYTTGIWELIGWMFLPSDFDSNTWFIVLNTYTPNGDQNWSAMVGFYGGHIWNSYAGGESLPLILGDWVELKLVIDLDSDQQTFYYGGNLLYQASWTENISGGGALDIGALDLYASDFSDSTPVYYDDLSLTMSTVATESRSWSAVKNLFR